MPPILASFISAQVLLFLIFGLGALVTAVAMVLSPNPVRSALFLVLNLFCVAVLYLLLNAYFLAAVQVIVYTGAIMVLFLFVIMLLNLGTPDRAVDRLKWQQPVAIAAGLILAAMLSITFTATVPAVPTIKGARPAPLARPAAVPGAGAPPISAPPPTVVDAPLTADNMGTAYGVGKTLYDPTQPWLFPFEITSILLLIAVVGAIVLARRPVPGEEMAA
jgi:NADH-quinone oxidoreductase subunit J